MSKTPVRKRQGERGNTMIEFGLSFVLFFCIILGVLDVARGIYTYSFLEGAAKEGSRYAMVHGSSSGSQATSSSVQTVVQQWLTGVVNPHQCDGDHDVDSRQRESGQSGEREGPIHVYPDHELPGRELGAPEYSQTTVLQ